MWISFFFKNKYCFFPMFKSSRLHFEEMCAQYLMRVEIPLKSALEQSSTPLRVIN